MQYSRFKIEIKKRIFAIRSCKNTHYYNKVQDAMYLPKANILSLFYIV